MEIDGLIKVQQKDEEEKNNFYVEYDGNYIVGKYLLWKPKVDAD